MQVLEGKPKIDYPTRWEYRVIGTDREKIKEAIIKAIKKDFDLKDGQISKTGKYVSLVVSVEVESEEERNQIFVLLEKSSEVNMVL